MQAVLGATNTENAIFLDEQAAISPVGPRAAGRRLLPRRLTHGGLFHPTMVGRLPADGYAEVVRASEALRRCKVLLVDFDNTLWEAEDCGEGRFRLALDGELPEVPDWLAVSAL